jgi:HrpA-like RNA helicase
MAECDKPSETLEELVDELILLSLSVRGRSVEDMGLLGAPESEDIESAKERLTDLGFIELGDNCVALTAAGKVVCALQSMRPESVRMVLQACEKFPRCENRAIKFAVILSSTESVFKGNSEVHEEDHSNHVCGDPLLELGHLKWHKKAASKSAAKTGKCSP